MSDIGSDFLPVTLVTGCVSCLSVQNNTPQLLLILHTGLHSACRLFPSGVSADHESIKVSFSCMSDVSTWVAGRAQVL